MMTYAEYIEKKNAIKAQLEELDNQIIAESGVKVGDVGNLGSPDGEEVLIMKVEVAPSSMKNKEVVVRIPCISKKTKNGKWSNTLRTPYEGVYLNGKKYSWL